MKEPSAGVQGTLFGLLMTSDLAAIQLILTQLNQLGLSNCNCHILCWGTVTHWETAAWLIPNSLASSRCEPANAINLFLSIQPLYKNTYNKYIWINPYVYLMY